MKVFLTCEAIGIVANALSEIRRKIVDAHGKHPNDYYSSISYGDSLSLFIISLVCYPDSTGEEKPYVRYTKKDATLIQDIILSGPLVSSMTKAEVAELAARRLLCDPLKVLEKYTRNKKLYDFDFERFRADWREMLIPTGLVGDGDCV